MEEEFIEEEYVSFETAKMLKEADFNWICDALFYEDGTQMFEMNFKNYNKAYPYTFSRPTQGLAAKWLREKHKLHIHCYLDYVDTTFRYLIQCFTDNKHYGNIFSNDTYSNYDEAMEAGLQEAIKLVNK